MKADINHTGWADLHTHTTHSDGLLSPAQVVAEAKSAGLRAIAITDHDEVGAIEPALRAAKLLGVEILSGVELSVSHKNFDVHILGYLFDHRHPRLTSLIRDFQNERHVRLDKILAKLSALGRPVSRTSVIGKAGAGSVGRPHIADAMVDAGMADDYYDAFNRFLADGRPAYVPKKKLSAIDAIRLIHEAGGLAALAHPGQDIPDGIVLEIIDAGIDAIETVHPRHGDARRKHYEALAQSYSLLTTGGSDFHGGRKVYEKIGEQRISYEIVEKMKDYLIKTRSAWA
jgi:hypothetical protein